MTLPCELPDFSVGSSTYLSALGRMYLRRRWVVLLAPPVLCAALSLALGDIRWLVVGLMLLFMAVPMVLALAYINYALSAEARWSLLDKTATIGQWGVALSFVDERMHDRFIMWSDIERVEVRNECFLLLLKVRRFTFVMLPFAAVEQAGVTIRDMALLLGRCVGGEAETSSEPVSVM